MKAFEAITLQQIEFEEAVGPPINYKDKRTKTIVNEYQKIEKFFNQKKSVIIDGIEIDSTGSWEEPSIIVEDGKRKLFHKCRSVNPFRYENPLTVGRMIDNVIVPGAAKALGYNYEKLAHSQFAGFNIQLQHNIEDVVSQKPCRLCPIKYIDLQQFSGNDLKTRPFDEPDNPDNINVIPLDSEKFWAISVYCSLTILRLLRRDYPASLPPIKLVNEISKYTITTAMGCINSTTFNSLEFPQDEKGKYDLDLWPKPDDVKFIPFIKQILPTIDKDPKLMYLKNKNQIAIE